MSYLGLVPSEHSTGQSRRLGQITRSGSRHARRLLVEAAWHYRNQPRIGPELERRHAGQPAAAVAISWSAQRRLHRVWSRMQRRGKRRTLIAVGHSILVAAYHILQRDIPYQDLGDDYFHRRQAEHAERYRNRLIRQLERLGHKVTLEPIPEAA